MLDKEHEEAKNKSTNVRNHSNVESSHEVKKSVEDHILVESVE